MVDYVVQITKDATKVTSSHHEQLRAAGFDDRGILQITLIASWFNYINRVADALGWTIERAADALQSLALRRVVQAASGTFCPLPLL